MPLAIFVSAGETLYVGRGLVDGKFCLGDNGRVTLLCELNFENSLQIVTSPLPGTVNPEENCCYVAHNLRQHPIYEFEV